MISRAALAEELEDLGDAMTDENYHTEAAGMFALARWVGSTQFSGPFAAWNPFDEELLTWEVAP